MDLVEIAVEAPLHNTLTYRIPPELADTVKIGSRVDISLGKRKSKGVVIGESNNSALKKIKPIDGLAMDHTLDPRTLEWLKWLSQYYLHPLGLVYSMAFAPTAAARIRKSKNQSPTFLKEGAIEKNPAPKPNAEQALAIRQIVEASEKNTFETFLLFGVTGSGKTEVYLQSIDEVLKLGKQVLVLVPEISLTPQLIKRFVGRFGENVAVIHSHLTEREKSDQWQSALNKEKKILVGARSALFCPLDNLGLIVVDEEHEPSFKQEELLKYNARDAAILKARIFKCPIVLGSATPSLESWQNTLSGKYKKLELKSRVEDRPLPTVNVIDLRQLKKEKRNYDIPSWLSPALFEELTVRLEKKEQVALFLNRRGYAQFALCGACGFTEQCPRCSVTLTMHRRGAQLLCHYCGFQKAMPPICPSCKSTGLKPVGLGTEKVKEELQLLFPKARIARADRDEITTRKDLEELLEKITNHEIDIIVGTQMIAKGHDFPELTLVGTLMADLGLHFPDFRSSERTFQLLTQVAGRAGRHQKSGNVVVQTYLPEHPAIRYSTNHDFPGFAEAELKERKELGYPPFGKIAILRIQGSSQEGTERMSVTARQEMEKLKQGHSGYQSIEVLGPVEAALSKLKNKYRFQIMLKTASAKDLNIFLQHFMKTAPDWLKSGVTMSVDVDPLQLL